MKARCSICQKHWIISIFTKIRKKGYICPHCFRQWLEKKGTSL